MKANVILVKDLKANHYLFGNKGNVWSNDCHISSSDSSTTLCGTPKLSTNHARLQGVKEIGCKKCIDIYILKTQNL